MDDSSSQDNTARNIYVGTNYIFPQNLDEYIDNGFCHFKIQGRELKESQLFAEFIPYLIRPYFYQMAISMINKISNNT